MADIYRTYNLFQGVFRQIHDYKMVNLRKYDLMWERLQDLTMEHTKKNNKK